MPAVHRVFRFVALLLALSPLSMYAQGTQPTQRALVRLMLASNRFPDALFELDGQPLLRQRTNTLSTYQAITPGRTYTLAVYGIEQGGPGPQLLKRITNFNLPASFVGTSIFDDNGQEYRSTDDTTPIPAGKARFAPVLLGFTPPPVLRFGNQTIMGSNGSLIVDP